MTISVIEFMMSIQADVEAACESIREADTVKKIAARHNWARGKLSAVENIINIGMNLESNTEYEMEVLKNELYIKLCNATKKAMYRISGSITPDELQEKTEQMDRIIKEATEEQIYFRGLIK